MEPLLSDLSEFVGLFNELNVEFIVVGGHAVAFHGHPRMTGDIDLFVRATEDNAVRVIAALDRFGFADHGLRSTDLTTPDNIVQLGTPPNRIDLLTSITGVSFDEAWSSRVAGRLGGHDVFYIGLEDLLKNKTASGRDVDTVDVKRLEKIAAEADQ